MGRAQFTETYLEQKYWNTPSNNIISSQQALLQTTALTHAAIEALADTKKVLIDIPQGLVAMELRFYGNDSDNGTDNVELYMAATTDSKPDYYRHFAQLAIIAGTMVFATDLEFYDTITPANEAWLTAAAEVSPANNTFGSYAFNTHGNSKLLVTASSAINTNLYVQWRQM
ncbi:hypothetical protein KAR91_50735 [Candidatus Pacearchaeota archaeon]|nr:hypothetical protein [Candidatus Pacearchaeota archaeon]